MFFVIKKKELSYIILLTHGNWGLELINSTEMICGRLENVYAFPLLPEQSIKSYIGDIESLVKISPSESIIIADLFGGTTSNVAAFISSKYNVIALSGLSIGMLIAADGLRRKYTGAELSKKIIEKSIDNCKDINKTLNDIDIDIDI